MIPQNLAMCRESRKLLNDLDVLASEHGCSTLVTPTQIYVADQITLKYYTAPVFNAIKSKVRSMKNISSKHFTVVHWVSVLNSMFAYNSGVKREMSHVHSIDDSVGNDGFVMLSRYLVADYGLHESEMIYDIVHKYSSIMIKDAVSIATKNNVYNIQYVNAILEKDQALSNIRKQELERLRERVNKSKSILDKKKVSHTIMDVASSQHNWQETKNNAELERKLKEMFGE